MNKINWGIIAPGHIASSFVKALIANSNSNCIAVGSRNIEKAQKFAQEWHFEKAYGSYQEVFKDPSVDIVYIASPHFNHTELSIQALKEGKSVICEKPAAVNARDFKKIIDCAKETGCFFMEAWWTAFNPSVQKAFDLIKEGTIGTIQHISANFCFANTPDPHSRLFNPEIGGGALLDVGIYPIGFAMRAAAVGLDSNKNVLCPTVIQSTARLGKTAADQKTAIDYWNSESFIFTKNKIAQEHTATENCITTALTSSIDSVYLPQTNDAYLYGTQGTIYLKNFWMAQEVKITDKNGKEIKTYYYPFKVNGYEYEIEEIIQCLTSHKKESKKNTLSDTLAVIKTMDVLRKQWNMKYSFEKDISTNKVVVKNDNSNNEIIIYTDGGCAGNPGPGGWGAVLLINGSEKILSGGEPKTTNNRMELTAAVRALEEVLNNNDLKSIPVSVYSDSQYVKNGITCWIKNWKKNGWKTANKQAVKNKDLWIELDIIYSKIQKENGITWKWVKGHAGIKYNEKCDELCETEIAKFK